MSNRSLLPKLSQFAHFFLFLDLNAPISHLYPSYVVRFNAIQRRCLNLPLNRLIDAPDVSKSSPNSSTCLKFTTIPVQPVSTPSKRLSSHFHSSQFNSTCLKSSPDVDTCPNSPQFSYKCVELIVDRPVYPLHVRHSPKSFLLCPDFPFTVPNLVNYCSFILLVIFKCIVLSFYFKFVIIPSQIRLCSSNSKPKCHHSSSIITRSPKLSPTHNQCAKLRSIVTHLPQHHSNST